MSLKLWMTSVVTFSLIGIFFFFGRPLNEILGGPPLLSSSRSIASNSKLPAYAPRLGTRYAYRFEREIQIDGLGPQEKWLLSGDLWVDVIEKKNDSFVTDFNYRISQQPSLKSPTLRAQISTDGKLISLSEATDPTVDESRIQGQAILRDLVAQWIFLANTDTVGEYRSEIRADLQRDHFTKVKLKYIESPHALPEILYSKHLLHWSRSAGFPERIEGQEQTTLASSQFPIISRTGYSIFLQETQQIPKQTQVYSWSPIRTLAIRDVSFDQTYQFVPALSWPELVTSLSQLDRLTSGEKMQWFGNLIRLIKQKPDTTQDIAEALTRYGSKSPQFRTLIGALASAGTPESQKALVDAYQSPHCDLTGKHLILNGLNTTQAKLETPTREFLTHIFHTETDSDLSKSAAYALGSSLQSTSDSNVVSLVHESWVASKTDRERTLVLDVIGNSGSQDFLPHIEEAIQSQSPTVRSKAVFALRRVSGDFANQLLERSYSDPSPAVRASAVSALRYKERNTAFIALLKSCSENDPSQSLRIQCTNQLTNKGSDDSP